MSKSLREFNTRQLNKWVRQQREKQRKLKRGKQSNVKAIRMSEDNSVDLYYMVERNDIKNAKKISGGSRNV